MAINDYPEWKGEDLENKKESTQTTKSSNTEKSDGGMNYGNIRDGRHGFKTYDSDEEGAQDQIRLLGVYQNKYKLNTIDGIINRWAPPSDNNKNNANYKSHIAKALGVGVNDEIDLSDPVVAGTFAHAQSQFEHGSNNIHHDENWFIDQASNQIGGNATQRATSAKKEEGDPLAGAELVTNGTTQNTPSKQEDGNGEDPLKGAELIKPVSTPESETSTTPEEPKSEGEQLMDENRNAALQRGGFEGMYAGMGLTSGQRKEVAPLIAFAATEGLATPALEAGYSALGVPSLISKGMSAVEGLSAGSVAAQETEAGLEGKGLVVPDSTTTAVDVGAGLALRGISKFVKPGWETVRNSIRKVWNEGKAADEALAYGEGPSFGPEVEHMTDEEVRQATDEHFNRLEQQSDRAAYLESKAPGRAKIIAPDFSDAPISTTGQTPVSRIASNVAGSAEKVFPYSKAIRSWDQSAVNPEGWTEAMNKDPIGSLITIGESLHTAISPVAAAKALPYATAANLPKQYIDWSHYRDIQRIIKNRKYGADELRQKLGELLDKLPTHLTPEQREEAEGTVLNTRGQ